MTYTDAMTLNFDGETVELIHVPNAHTDNDTLVHFKRANVIHASGTFGGAGAYPFFDTSSGGSLAGMIAAEQKMLALADASTKIMADEGEPAGIQSLKATHDMLVALRARVQKLVDAGKSEDEAVAAKPVQGLGGPWEHASGFLTADVFTRMAYQSLKARASAAR